MHKNYIFPKKSDFSQIPISQVDIELPELKDIAESKAAAIGKWLMKFIEQGLKTNKISVNNIMPSKADFAYKLGVSIGTMQNAFRYIEDLGYVESKQCIGTLVRDYKKPVTTMRKLTSKRDSAAEAIKRYIQTGSFKLGMTLPSSRTVATLMGYSANTTRLALDYLCAQGILEHRYKNSNEFGWIIKSMDFDTIPETADKSKTLVEMVVKDLENYISNNLKAGDKIPSHIELAKSLKTSLKTVHDALKILADRGILLPRRGKYGTTVIKKPNDKSVPLKPEMSIFAPAKDTAFYHYEKTQNRIKRMIAEEYDIGEKLPSIIEMSKMLDLSPNTIRKAFHNLGKEGYLVFSRGRYGGTFIIDIPEIETQTFKWLAVNPQYIKEKQNAN
ncbi:GntR family transcriptional regulator [bacterium]|nr:GntR family transcriptional regulator [bacterium]